MSDACGVVVYVGDATARVITGCAGSGKTSALVGQVSQLVASGCPLAQVLVLTGSRVQARRLRRLILARLPGAHLHPRITTLFGWAASVMAEFYSSAGYAEPPELLSAPQHLSRIRQLLPGFAHRWPAEFGVAASTNEFSIQVQDALMQLRRLRLGADDLRLMPGVHWAVLADYFTAYLTRMRAEGVIDYTELIHQTYLLLAHDEVRHALAGQLREVFVDEAAELDDAQLALLASLAALGIPVTLYGDEDTSVYSFRGGGWGFERRSEAAFTAAGVKVTHTRMNSTYRVPTSRSCEIFASKEAEVSAVVRHLFDGRGMGFAWRDMAVITHGEDVAALARELGGAEIPVVVDSVGLPLSQEPLVKVLRSALLMLLSFARGTARAESEQLGLAGACPDADDNLASPDVGGSSDDPRAAVVGEATESLIRDVAASPLGGVDELSLLRAKSPAALNKLRTHWHALAASLKAGASVEEVLWSLWSASSWPTQLQAEALSSGVGAPQANETLDAAIAVFDLAARHLDWCGVSGVERFIELLDEQVLPADNTREDTDRDAVRVLDFYQAKGEQWKLVLVPGAKEGSWPQTGVVRPLFDLDEAVSGVRDAASLRREQIMAERHAFALATSRASERLVLTAAPDLDEDGCAPSRFVAELGIEVVVGGVPLESAGVLESAEHSRSLSELVSRLRAVTLDATVSAALREHAARNLQIIAAAVDSRGAPLAPAANPDTWWGVGGWSGAIRVQIVADDEPVVLSSSQVGVLLSCPRRWFLETQAQGQTRAGAKTQVGTLLHHLFETDARATLAGEDAVSVASARDYLQSRWAALGWSSPAIAGAALENAIATFGRYRRWADGRGERQLVAAETPFEVSLVLDSQPVRVRGRVDRLELDGENRVVVVDFKTGKAGRVDAYLDQLGCYELAAASSAFDVCVPLTVGPTELVWPAIDPRAKNGGDIGCKVTPAPPAIVGAQEFDAYPSEFHARLASAASIVRSGTFDARASVSCSHCGFKSGCPTLAGQWGDDDE